jgi:hypothetical protein
VSRRHRPGAAPRGVPPPARCATACLASSGRPCEARRRRLEVPPRVLPPWGTTRTPQRLKRRRRGRGSGALG